MIKTKIPMKQRIYGGYTMYATDQYTQEILICKWYVYPIFRTLRIAEFKKYEFYRFLNRHNIMKTPESCIMQLSDIWRR